MTEKPKDKPDEREVDLEAQNGELLPDREVMTLLHPGDLGPPVLDITPNDPSTDA